MTPINTRLRINQITQQGGEVTLMNLQQLVETLWRAQTYIHTKMAVKWFAPVTSCFTTR